MFHRLELFLGAFEIQVLGIHLHPYSCYRDFTAFTLTADATRDPISSHNIEICKGAASFGSSNRSESCLVYTFSCC